MKEILETLNSGVAPVVSSNGGNFIVFNGFFSSHEYALLHIIALIE